VMEDPTQIANLAPWAPPNSTCSRQIPTPGSGYECPFEIRPTTSVVGARRDLCAKNVAIAPQGRESLRVVSDPTPTLSLTTKGVPKDRPANFHTIVRVQYVREPSATIRKTFPFYEEAQRLARSESGRIFKRYLIRNLAC
jgi:hypothetical protein